MSMDGHESIKEQHILLIDDFALRRASVKKFLETWACEGHYALDALDHVPMEEIDEAAAAICLIVLNIGAGSIEAPAAQEQIEALRKRFPEVPLVVMSDRDAAVDVIATLRAGARGFISSRMDPHVMLRALDFIMCGGVFFPPDALLEMSDVPGVGEWQETIPLAASQLGLSSNGLTRRQHAVVKLLQQGQSNKQIARELRMCESTVKVHVRQIMRKLGASNRTQAALCAREKGLAGDEGEVAVEAGIGTGRPVSSAGGRT